LNRGTGEFLKSAGQDRVITCADEFLMKAWELNNGRKTEGGLYRRGQRQKTMKMKFEKNFCMQIKELATTNHWHYCESSHILVHSSNGGRNNLILISSENISGVAWDITQRVMVIPYGCFGATYRSHLQGNIPEQPRSSLFLDGNVHSRFIRNDLDKQDKF
jgi:hypothetical protein